MTRDLPMTSICPSLTVSCHLQLSKSSPAPELLLMWSISFAFLVPSPYRLHSSCRPPSPKMLYMYFSGSIYLSSFWVTLLSFWACFTVPTFLQYRAWAQRHPCFYIFPLWQRVWCLCKSLCFIKIFAVNYSESHDHVGTKQGPVWCWWSFSVTAPICSLLPVSTCCHHSHKLHLLLPLLFQAWFGTRSVRLRLRFAWSAGLFLRDFY